MRIGLALGAGGVVGASWMIGALEALEQQTGFRPAEVSEVLGTSVGSLIGVMVAAAVPTAAMAAYASGVEGGVAGDPDDHDHDAMRLRLGRVPLPIGPGSWRMVLAPRNRTTLLTGLLPRGAARTDAISRLVERAVGSQWPAGCDLRIVACDDASGERVEFARSRGPLATPAEAVAASCAIPAVYEPVVIGGRRYIDGGVHSHSNLDLLLDAELDAVIALNPMSSGAWVAGGGVRERLAGVRRRYSGALLDAEVRALRARGTNVLVLEPAFADLAAMGPNLMARDRLGAVIEAGRSSTERSLRRLGRKRLRSVGLAPV
jgi:NTE family protein